MSATADDNITVTPFNQSIITDGDVQITAAGSSEAINDSLREALAHGEEPVDPDPDAGDPTLSEGGDQQETKTPEAIAAQKASDDAAAAAAAAAKPVTPPAPSKGVLDLQRRVADSVKQREEQRKRADLAEADRIRVTSENIRIREAAIAAGVKIPGLTDQPAPTLPGTQPAAVDPIAALGPAPKFEDFADQADPYAAFNTASAEYNRKYADAAVAKDRMAREADEKTARDQAAADAAAVRYGEEVQTFVGRRAKFYEEKPEAKAIADAYFAAEQAAEAEWNATHDPVNEPYQGEYLSPLVQGFLRIEEGGPLMAVHFMQNPEDLRAIQALPTRDRMVAALGRLESKLLRDGVTIGASTPETPSPAAAAAAKLRTSAISKPGAGSKPSTTPGAAAPRTSAHTPPPVAGSSPSATGTQALEDADADDFIRQRNKQEGRTGRRAR